LKNNRIKACVLLSAVLFAGTFGISIGETQARYSNRIFCSTVLEIPEPEIESEVLFKNGETPVTVYLGKTAEEKTFLIPVKSSGADTKEKISWNIKSEGTGTEDVLAEFRIGEKNLSSGEEIEIGSETETSVEMKIIPPSGGHGEITATVEVALGTELSGRFKVVFLEAAAVEESSGESGTTDIPPEEGTGENPPAEEPESESPESSSGNAEGSAPTVDAGTKAEIKALPFFDSDGKLPVAMDLPGGIKTVKIGIVKDGIFENLPEGTKISLDNGGSYYLVSGGADAEFSVSEIHFIDGKQSVLLDFEKAGIEPEKEITVAIETTAISGLTETYEVLSTPIDFESGKIKIASSVEQLVETEEREKPYILSGGEWLETSFPEEWIENGAAQSIFINILSGYSDGNPVFESAEENFKTEYVQNDLNGSHDFKIMPGEYLPGAGTYELIIRWEFEGICFYNERITFFINYLADIYSTFES